MHHWDLSYEAAVLRYIKTWFRIEVEPHGADRPPEGRSHGWHFKSEPNLYIAWDCGLLGEIPGVHFYRSLIYFPTVSCLYQSSLR